MFTPSPSPSRSRFFASAEPSPSFSLALGWWRASVFPPSPSNSLHFCFAGCCTLPASDSLPPTHPLARSLALAALPPFLVHSASHSLSRLFHSPSLVHLLARTGHTSLRDAVGGSVRARCIFRTDAITAVLHQHAAITPSGMPGGGGLPPLVLYGAAQG